MICLYKEKDNYNKKKIYFSFISTISCIINETDKTNINENYLEYSKIYDDLVNIIGKIDNYISNFLKTEEITKIDQIDPIIIQCFNNNIPIYTPKDKDELKKILTYFLEIFGLQCNLNWLDTSQITDMSELFMNWEFDGDISKWDVGNVTDMSRMFQCCKFNGDISNWNVSNVKLMYYMFDKSSFNQDISNWDVSNVTDMESMFCSSKFNQDISRWDVSKVTNMSFMFYETDFNGDISNWDISKVEDMGNMFAYSKFNRDISNWDMSNVNYISYMFQNCPIKDEYKPKI